MSIERLAEMASKMPERLHVPWMVEFCELARVCAGPLADVSKSADEMTAALQELASVIPARPDVAWMREFCDVARICMPQVFEDNRILSVRVAWQARTITDLRDELKDSVESYAELKSERDRLSSLVMSITNEGVAYRVACDECVAEAVLPPNTGNLVADKIRQQRAELEELRPILDAAKRWYRHPFDGAAAELSAVVGALLIKKSK